jgi:hypothetical protein
LSHRARHAFVLAALFALAVDARAEPPPNVAKRAPLALPAEPSDCDQRLKAVAAFARLPPISGPGECGGADMVKLEAVTMPDRSRVAIAPPAMLRCSMAEAVAQFVRTEMGPAAAQLGAPLAAVTTADAYDCRNRNRQQAAKISEHGRGNALDIGAVKLANRTTYSLTGPAAPESATSAFRARVREAACHFFTTVLGPGSDAYHNEHIHLDRAERKHGYRICQWDLKPASALVTVAATVPLPQPKPVALREAQSKPMPTSRTK